MAHETHNTAATTRRGGNRIEQIIVVMTVLFMLAVFVMLIIGTIMSKDNAINNLPPAIPTPKP